MPARSLNRLVLRAPTYSSRSLKLKGGMVDWEIRFAVFGNPSAMLCALAGINVCCPKRERLSHCSV
jgi:hypothetical protein